VTLSSAVRISLWISAPANLIVATAIAFPSSSLGSLLELPDTHPFYGLLSGAMVGLFGVAYGWLALQPEIDRPLLCLGACGKLLAVLISISLFTAGELSGVTAAVISGDLVFVVLWSAFLFSNRSGRGA